MVCLHRSAHTSTPLQLLSAGSNKSSNGLPLHRSSCAAPKTSLMIPTLRLILHVCSCAAPPDLFIVQVQQGKRSRIGGKLQVNSRGVASLALQLRSDRPQWWGLAGLVPLVNLGLDALRYALSRRRGEKGQEGGQAEGASWDEQQQQQYMPELAQLLQQHQAALLHQQQ